MTVQQTTRVQVYTWSSGDDPFTRSQMDESHKKIEERVATFLSGTLGNRPVADIISARMFYLATDQNVPNGILYYCDGSTWVAVNSFAAPESITPGDAQTIGTAATLSRSDHKHAMLPFGTDGQVASVGTSASAGSLAAYARADHVHVLGSNSVTSAALAAGSVTAGKIGTAGISASGQFAAGVVDSAALGTGSVTAGKVGTGGVSASGQFAAGVVDSAALGTGSVTAGKIGTAGISASGQFAAGVVDSAALGTGSVTAGKIGTAGISASGQFATGVVNSAALGTGSVTAGKIGTAGISASNQFATGVVDSDALGANVVTRGKIATTEQIPTGSIMQFAGSSAPTGWLLCDGSSVSQSSYTALYAVIGNSYNIGGEIVGNFRLPDLRSRIAAGVSGMNNGIAGSSLVDASDRISGGVALASAGGSALAVLSENQLPAHSHGMSHSHSGTAVAAGDHDHAAAADATTYFVVNKLGLSSGGGLSVSNGGDLVRNTQRAGTHSHTLTVNDSAKTITDPVGSGQGHNNLQPYIGLNYIIKS